MSLVIRRILFVFFVIFFLVAGIAILFYSTGYRYHFAKQKIEKTGQFAVDSRPQDVDIFIDGQKLEQPFRSFFRLPKRSGKERVASILSGQYSLRLSKEGFFDWSRQINILPGQRFVLQDIVLVRHEKPRAIQNTPLSQKTEPRVIKKEKEARLAALLKNRSIISNEYEDTLIIRSQSGTELVKKLPQGFYRASKLSDISVVRWIDKSNFFGFNDFEIWKVSLRSETQPEQSLITRYSEKISDPVLFAKKGFLAYIIDAKKIILLDIRDSQAVHQYTLAEGNISDIEKNDSNENELLFTGVVDGVRGTFILSLFER